jgi:cell division initiation protein
MRLTPLDIQNHPFSSRIRGLDRAEVEAFLHLVAEDYESLVREVATQRERIRGLEARVAELTSSEKDLQQTLVTAHSLSEDLKRTAVKEAEVLVSEAELRAEKILEAAHRRVARLAEDVREMKLLRSRIGASIRSTIETHLSLLDGLCGELPEDDALLQGKVAYLPRPPRSGSASGPGGNVTAGSET